MNLGEPLRALRVTELYDGRFALARKSEDKGKEIILRKILYMVLKITNNIASNNLGI